MITLNEYKKVNISITKNVTIKKSRNLIIRRVLNLEQITNVVIFRGDLYPVKGLKILVDYRL